MAKGGMVVTFVRERETKNTIRYQKVVANGDVERIGTLYVQKWALRDLGMPERLTVEIRPA